LQPATRDVKRIVGYIEVPSHSVILIYLHHHHHHHTIMPALKKNIGVYTDPDHNLYIADASPHHEDVTDPSKLKHGEVVIQIRSTGICG